MEMVVMQPVVSRREHDAENTFVEKRSRHLSQESYIRGSLRARVAAHADGPPRFELETLDVDGVGVAVFAHPAREPRHVATAVGAQVTHAAHSGAESLDGTLLHQLVE